MTVTDLATEVDPDAEDRTTPAPPNPPNVRPQPGGRGGGSQLTRTTVNLTPQSVSALDRMVENGSNTANRSELINRGIQVLEIIQGVLGRSNRLTVKRDDGTEETIWIVSG